MTLAEIILTIITSLLLILLIVLFILIFTRFNKKEEKVEEDPFSQELLTSNIKNSITEGLLELTKNSNELAKANKDDINKTIQEIQYQLDKSIGNKLTSVDEKLEKNLETVSEKLGKVSIITENLDKLDNSVNSLNKVLDSSQKRGAFGEEILEYVLEDTFGEGSDAYQFQYKLTGDDSKLRPDAVVRMPEPINLLCIDAKFPFENYRKIFDSKLEENETYFRNDFIVDINKQIDKIAKDYIIKNKTAEYTIMFLPSDGIYNFLQSDDEFFAKVVKRARKKNVIISSPSTLKPILLNLKVLKFKYEQNRNIKKIIELVDKLNKNMTFFEDRYKDFGERLDKLNEVKTNLDITVHKVKQNFRDIKANAVSYEDIES